MSVLCSGVLSQTADTTVKVWSVLLPQLLSLGIRLGVVVLLESTTLKTNTRLKEPYAWGSFKKGVQDSWSKLSSTYSYW
jgi:hypothetical protein